MNTDSPRIIVSGLPTGIGLIRSIRRSHPHAFIVGLAYNKPQGGLDSGEGPDAVYLMPHLSFGAQAWLHRLDEVLVHSSADFLIPTLDAEIRLLAGLEHEFARRGLLTCLPDPAMLSRRTQNHLPALAYDCHVAAAATKAVYGILGGVRAAAELGYPLMVKGRDFGAQRVHDEGEFISVTTRFLAECGAPAMVQQCIRGPEFGVLGIGDGTGGMRGLSCIRRSSGSELRDHKLEAFCARLVSELKWRGPFEIEVMNNDSTNELSLLRFNASFPGWIDGLADQGANVASLLLEMMTQDFQRPEAKTRQGLAMAGW